MKRLIAIILSVVSIVLVLASCGKENITSAIIPQTDFIEIEVDTSEETGELTYSDPVRIGDLDKINALLDIINGAQEYELDEFVTFECCPIVTFYLSDGSLLYLSAMDYKGIFYTCRQWNFSDKTMYRLPDDFKLATYIEALYNENK